jgi:oligopeptide/dipeptide ABC transporter ATP-binding protein
MILGLVPPTSGTVFFDGAEVIGHAGSAALRGLRRRMQPVFQDPFAALNPRMTVAQIISEPFLIHQEGPRGDPRALLAEVGLDESALPRYPHEFSGGQRQRIGIARALSVMPRFIVADEPVSALDVSIQAQVINLLQDLQRELGLTLLLITHDLGVVEYLADRVIVMYLGRLMEIAPRRELFRNPRHPYTQALLSAIPVPDPDARPRRMLLKGDMPGALDPPSGCVFRTRCPLATGDCANVVPPLEAVSPQHFKACIRS